MTKSIIVVKMPGFKLLYIILAKGSSWPYLISKVLVTYYNAYDWARTLFTARLFLIRYNLLVAPSSLNLTDILILKKCIELLRCNEIFNDPFSLASIVS